MKIPIKKHTKVRRPVSRWHIRLVDGERYIHYFTKDRYEALYQDAFHKPITILVQDISIGLENPLDLKWPLKNIPYMMKQEFVTPKEFEEMTSPKPSLLTRVKNKLKR